MRHKSLAILIVIVSLLLFSNGCGPSYEEKQAKKETKRKEMIQKYEEKEKRAVEQIANKHNAILFPSKRLGTATFTYEFQQFIKAHSQVPIVFKGYLEDIEQTKNGIIIEFLCPLGENYFINKKAIRFRLTILESSVEQFLKVKKEDYFVNKLRYLSAPDYYVVAKIENIGRIRIYEFDGVATEKEVEIETEVSNGFMALGKFVDCVPIPKELN